MLNSSYKSNSDLMQSGCFSNDKWLAYMTNKLGCIPSSLHYKNFQVDYKKFNSFLSGGYGGLNLDSAHWEITSVDGNDIIGYWFLDMSDKHSLFFRGLIEFQVDNIEQGTIQEVSIYYKPHNMNIAKAVATFLPELKSMSTQ